MSDDRRFQVWDYDVSHARLLIRSPKTDILAHNVDFRFYGVEYIQTRTSFQGLTVEEVSDWPNDDKPAIEMGPHDRIFLLHTAGRTDFIVAAVMEMEQNDLEIFVSSLTSVND